MYVLHSSYQSKYIYYIFLENTQVLKIFFIIIHEGMKDSHYIIKNKKKYTIAQSDYTILYFEYISLYKI